MTFAPFEVPDCVGCDTSAKLTAASARELAAAGYRFVFRYVPLPGLSGAGDISPEERDAILGAGLLLGLVQHARLPGWRASAADGTEEGKRAADAASAIDYPPGCHLGFDLEGCGTVGSAVFDHVDAWCAPVIDAGFPSLLYVGFASGLSPVELYSLPRVHRYWKDEGPRGVDVRGFCLRQGATVRVGGVEIDPDVARADLLGGRVSLMGPPPWRAGCAGA